MKTGKIIQWIRLGVLTLFIIIVTITSIKHQIMGGGPTGSPPIDSICPFGAIETIYKIVAQGEFLKRTYTSNFVVLGGAVILAVLLGRFFCGWICAIGGMQDLTGKLGRKLLKKRFVIPVGIDKFLRYLKYPILIVILFFTWKTADLIIRPYDPFAAYAHITAGFEELLGEFLIGFIILIGSLILSFFYDRFFCKYLCPLGGFLAIISRFGLYRIKRDQTTCINCNKCTKACPVNIDVAKADFVKNAECINCMECVSACPTNKNTLKPQIAGLFLKSGIIAVIGVSIYFGSIGIGKISGLWQTGESSLEEMLTDNGNLNPYYIRGFMKIKDIIAIFNIDKEVLYNELNIDQQSVPVDTKVKDIQLINPDVTEEKVRVTVDHIIGFGGNTSNQTDSCNETMTPQTEEHILTADPASIKGSMSVDQVCSQFGISKADLYRELSVDPAKLPVNPLIKDIKNLINIDNPQFEIGNIREAVIKIRNQ